MVGKDYISHSHHYLILVLAEAMLLGLYLAVADSVLRLVLSVGTGMFYIVWGVYTHRGELTTSRLMLEYVTVGLLASLMLGSLVYTT